jgi:thermostable 8-oxoguanine DNA glycosylase
MWTRNRREEFEAFVYKPAEGELAADGAHSVSAEGDASRSEADAQGEGRAITLESDVSSNTEENKKQEPAVDTEVKEENEKQENAESKSQVSVERELDVPHLTQKALDRELVHTKIRGLCWKVASHPHHHSPVTRHANGQC